MSSFSRRSFMSTVGGSILVGSAVSLSSMQPVERKKGYHFKTSLAAYSYRKELTSQPPQMTLLEGFIDVAAEAGLDAIEPTAYYFPEPVTPEYLAALKRRAFLNGLDISGIAIRTTLTYPPGKKRDEQIEHTIKWIGHAAQLDAPFIRIFAGTCPEEISPEEARRNCVETIELLCAESGKHGIFLALENHGGIVNTASELMSVIQEVRSGWLGVNLDSGNFPAETLYADLERVAPYAVTVQLKINHHTGKDPDHFAKVADILRKVGYRGYVALEYEGEEDATIAVPKLLKSMKDILKS